MGFPPCGTEVMTRCGSCATDQVGEVEEEREGEAGGVGGKPAEPIKPDMRFATDEVLCVVRCEQHLFAKDVRVAQQWNEHKIRPRASQLQLLLAFDTRHQATLRNTQVEPKREQKGTWGAKKWHALFFVEANNHASLRF